MALRKYATWLYLRCSNGALRLSARFAYARQRFLDILRRRTRSPRRHWYNGRIRIGERRGPSWVCVSG